MITKAALLLFRDNNGDKQLLFARAKGKPFYVFPGGKQEADETIEEALQRELQEELGTTAHDVTPLGNVSGHTPDGRDMTMHLYSGALEKDPQPQSEIEEITWMSKPEALKKSDQMTPMTLDHVIPYLTQHGIW